MDSMFDFNYVQGYTAALLDFRMALIDAEYDVRCDHKTMSKKLIERLLDFVINSRVILREDPCVKLAWDATNQCFVMYNAATNKTVAREKGVAPK